MHLLLDMLRILSIHCKQRAHTLQHRQWHGLTTRGKKSGNGGHFRLLNPLVPCWVGLEQERFSEIAQSPHDGPMCGNDSVCKLQIHIMRLFTAGSVTKKAPA